MITDLNPDTSRMKPYVLLSLIILSSLFATNPLSAQGVSYKHLAVCEKDFSDILQSHNNEDVTAVPDLPPGLYLARSVTQGLESKKEKYFSYQSLLEESKSNPEVCYQGEPTSILKTQAFIPTVIDQTTAHKMGHTFWTLSATLDKINGAVSAKRSLIPNENYKEALKTQGYTVTSTQKAHDEYQIRLERKIASDWKETIVIVYDQF
jgi:hypothetical protein